MILISHTAVNQYNAGITVRKVFKDDDIAAIQNYIDVYGNEKDFKIERI